MNRTPVTAVKLVPVMTTCSPTPAPVTAVGDRLVKVGAAAVTVKLVALVAVPYGVVT